MDVNFKLIVILIAAFLLLALLVDAWFRERRLQIEVYKSEHKKDNLEDGFDRAHDSYISSSNEAGLYMNTAAKTDEPHFENQISKTPVPKMVAKQSSPQGQLKDDFIVINVIAKKGGYFASYDLLQAISATGMQYGAMNIFHFVEDSPRGKLTLFSLASATEPGEFDLNDVGNLSCAGLTLFMNIARVPDPGDVFVLMLETAEQLAEDLDGELRAAPNIPWSDDIFHHYENKIVNQLKLI